VARSDEQRCLRPFCEFRGRNAVRDDVRRDGGFEPAVSKVLWFSAAYLVGALTPASELLVRFSGFPSVFVATSFVTFVLAFYVSAVAITKFYQQQTPWLLLIGLFILSVSVRVAIWDGPRNNFIYEFFYQFPFAVAALVCAVFVLRERARGLLETALGAVFLVLAAHFLVKPILAAHFGSGSTATAYASSAYTLFSQSGTGILLISIGLLLVLVVTPAMLSEAEGVSEIDTLSGLLNRRGFNRRAETTVARKTNSWQEISLLIFDLDHFKKFNDLYGHDVGDGVIVAFSEILRICSPPSAIVARLGGEEFAVLLNTSEAEAISLGNKIRGPSRPPSAGSVPGAANHSERGAGGVAGLCLAPGLDEKS
jgi:GGDEF domain-containing protein